MSTPTPIDPKERSVQRLVDALIRHRGEIESVVMHIQWRGTKDDPAESQVSWSEQPHTQLGYAVSRIQADILPMLYSTIEEGRGE